VQDNVNDVVLDDYFHHLQITVSGLTTTAVMKQGVGKVVGKTME